MIVVEFKNFQGEWEEFRGTSFEVAVELQKIAVRYGTVQYRIISNIPILNIVEEE